MELAAGFTKRETRVRAKHFQIEPGEPLRLLVDEIAIYHR
jgi:hypothetical protein